MSKRTPTERRSDVNVVAVTGGRNYRDWGHVLRVLTQLHASKPIDMLVTGGATGADGLAEAWATQERVQFARLPVTDRQWEKGGHVGPRRNYLMLVVCQPNKLVAFPGNRGTNGCVREAQDIGGISIVDERKNTNA